ncbi:hypothetical protein FACS1894132_13700 [Clostridia bacterium]|nr:hypothetical protein FACS1894132_13700 [Clostridia bacterium]
MSKNNEVKLVGRLVADPDFRLSQNGLHWCSFRLAVNNYNPNTKENTADFFNIVAYRELAQFVSATFKKGNAIVIIGKIKNNEYTDKNGVKQHSASIVADNIYSDTQKDFNRQNKENNPHQINNNTTNYGYNQPQNNGYQQPNQGYYKQSNYNYQTNNDTHQT